MKSKNQRQEVYVVYSNYDLTEGRDGDYPIAVCELESTAIRVGKGGYIQGSNCPYYTDYIEYKDNNWRGPIALTIPSKEDIQKEKEIKREKALKQVREKALAKAKELGLTEEEIKALQEK